MDALQVLPEISDALHTGTPVVALESTVITHGLPSGPNLEVARRIEATVRASGAVPATIAVLDGIVRVGLTDRELDALADQSDRDLVTKASSRELPWSVATRGWASTTVGATCVIAAEVGIEVFATGGIGGVHRGAGTTFDESADLVDLARTGRLVVSAGIKSILDVAATMERLETLGVLVVGVGTDTVPGFWVRDSAVPVPRRSDHPTEICAAFRARDALGLADRSLIAMRPIDGASALDQDLHDRIVAEALESSASRGVSGQDVTPFILSQVHERSGGASVAANEALLLGNAVLAAELAALLAAPPTDH